MMGSAIMSNPADRFEECDLEALEVMGINLNDTPDYSEEFSGRDVLRLVVWEVPSSVANEYNPNLNMTMQTILQEHVLKRREADPRNNHRQYPDGLMLEELGITGEFVDEYDPVFRSSGYVSHCFIAGLHPLVANLYHNSPPLQFNPGEALSLFNRYCSPVQAQRYPQRLRTQDIMAAVRVGWSAEKVRHILKLGYHDIVTLANVDTAIDNLECYANAGFDEFEIVHCVFAGSRIKDYRRTRKREERSHIRGSQEKKAGQYDSRFDRQGKAALLRHNVPPSVENTYPDQLDGDIVARCFAMGLLPDMFPTFFPDQFLELLQNLNRITSRAPPTVPLDDPRVISKGVGYEREVRPFTDDPSTYHLIGVGTFGFVVYADNNLGGQNLWKVSYAIDNECDMLRLLYYDGDYDWEFNPDIPNEYVINLVEEWQIGVLDTMMVDRPEGLPFFNESDDNNPYFWPLAVTLEHLTGESIGQLISKQGPLPHLVAPVGRDILNGLLELRRKRMYHRDVHIGNILWDNDQSRAKIIDLGAATQDKDAVFWGNRPCGGNNDCVSLGQTLFSLATGSHLFYPSIPLTIGTVQKEEIVDQRQRLYESPELRRGIFRDVERRVADSTTARLINVLLDGDLFVQPERTDIMRLLQSFDV